MFARLSGTVRKAAIVAAAMISTAACALAGTVTISSPGSGATVASSFHLVASASSSYSVTGMSVYLDGSKKTGVGSNKIDTYISAGAGYHRLTVQGVDKTGTFSKTIYVTVGSTSSGSTTSTSSGGTAISNIDQMTGWASCTTCAGANGSGPTAKYSMYQTSSPSMDGKSAQFNISGSTDYANALWWKQLGGKSSARHFVYDLYFYLKNASAPQALEFDVNQSVGGKKYIFGTECGIKGGTWRVWSAATSWQSTGIPCGTQSAYKWHHVIWEFERTTDSRVKFVSVTLDGRKSYVNRVYTAKSSSVSELNTAIQLDMNGSHTAYSMWVDKVTLRYW